MFGLLKKKKDDRPVVVVTLNARLQPMHRHESFDEPLDDWLRENNLGEVCGGGTAFDPREGVQSCDIEVRLASTDDATLARLTAQLHELSAPVGSKLFVGEREIAIGASEGLALHLNGTDLSDEVYASGDPDELVDLLQAALEGHGQIMSHWDGQRETSLFMYGRSYADMAAAIAPVVASYPTCEKARLEKIA